MTLSQYLDTGTGTFLAEVVKYIYKKAEGQCGIWSNYFENHLIPIDHLELLHRRLPTRLKMA
jgi:hypothetical protein